MHASFHMPRMRHEVPFTSYDMTITSLQHCLAFQCSCYVYPAPIALYQLHGQQILCVMGSQSVLIQRTSPYINHLYIILTLQEHASNIIGKTRTSQPPIPKYFRMSEPTA